MKKTFLLLLVLFVSLYSHAQEQQIDSILTNLSVSYEKIKDHKAYELYELHIKQPIDHADTSKGFFHQKVYLSHKSFASPTVIVTSGYDVNQIYNSELTSLLEANQILVEHRYFGESMPDSMDYRFLNLKQATAILMKNITYSKKKDDN